MTDTYQRPEDQNKVSDDKGWLEPESAANADVQPEYPYNNITMTESGHFLEMDDTPGRERVRLQHRSGTFMEMHPDGTEVHKILGDGYEIITRNKDVLIKGTCNITIKGNAIIDVEGDKIERVQGDYSLQVGGDFTLGTKGSNRILSEGDSTIGANDGLGSLRLVAGDVVEIVADAQVEGLLYAQRISSASSIDARGGIGAGPQGFVSESGGLAIGLPVAAPGTIMCAGALPNVDPENPSPPIPLGTIVSTGTIASGIILAAPLATFGTMQAVWMSDILNTRIFNTHVHKVYTTTGEGIAVPVISAGSSGPMF